jgi:glutamate synthase domain-containing protein 1
MLITMTERGPDSAGVAIYGDGDPGHVKLTLRADRPADLSCLAGIVDSDISIAERDTHAVLTVPSDREGAVRTAIAQAAPHLSVLASGNRMELYKEVGAPAQIAARFALNQMSGTHAIGHTRMATESAVTTEGAHPFSTGMDQCLVHNGSLSNHNSVRRRLRREGLSFRTDNDTEVAAGYLAWRIAQGDTLEAALTGALADLDGFFTFVVGTESGFAVLRDPIACKPAVMVETDRYVAFGTEYRALANLPDVESGQTFEPEPGRVYAWGRA